MVPPTSWVLVAITFWLGLLYGRGLAPTSMDLAPARAAHLARLGPTTGAALPPAQPPAAPLLEEQEPPFILLGVITNPSSFELRRMLREFAVLSGGEQGGVRTEFVVGQSYFRDPPPAALQAALAAEAAEHGDIVFVNGREKLPHVGKATEKSAAWWSTAPKRSAASIFCKTDDDSLIHLGHLSASLQAVVRTVEPKYFMYSYMRWRGWLPFNRLQACGGGWGGPGDALHQMNDPVNHCELAEGPFPQGTGTLTCMSGELAIRLADEPHFETFQQVARARNDFGTPCKTAVSSLTSHARAALVTHTQWQELSLTSSMRSPVPAQKQCASQSPATHMWHHEDAGISYNVWKTVTRLGLQLAVVHLP